MNNIEVRNVSKSFNMAKELVDNIKEVVIKKAKGTLKFEEV